MAQEIISGNLSADGALLRLVSEAYHFHFAYLFDPGLALHASLVEPLPHQIAVVYEQLLPWNPLRYLLADDVGAGKKIMAGLLLKELRVRGELQRCLILCSGNALDAWQSELSWRFQLPFTLLTRELMEGAPAGNAFTHYHFILCRLDQLSRNWEVIKPRLEQSYWDIIICDDAHKMVEECSMAERENTATYQLGMSLHAITRRLLFLSANPQSGKPEKFQSLMTMLDPDRFVGKWRHGMAVPDVSDLMRVMSKEKMVRLDGTPLFPQRRIYSIGYRLSEPQSRLYEAVTNYVREELIRADRFSTPDTRRRGNLLRFAMLVLQRRSTSSPEAIHLSLKRRRKKLEKRLDEEIRQEQPTSTPFDVAEELAWLPDLADLESFYEEAAAAEIEQIEEELQECATSACSHAELKSEISRLQQLEEQALQVRRTESDAKWEVLAEMLRGTSHLKGASELSNRQSAPLKLILFTEHHDTIHYLTEKIRVLLGRAGTAVTIHGSMSREERLAMAEMFRENPDVHILVTTDAAGEGLEFGDAHLMLHYDLPWEPVRIIKRFGIIYRIGQTKACHLWNLVAENTLEGALEQRLFSKLSAENDWEVLDQCFGEESLAGLILQQLRGGDKPDLQTKLLQRMDKILDRKNLQKLSEERAKIHPPLNPSQIEQIQEKMTGDNANCLAPDLLAAFFTEAFRHLGGTLKERGPHSYEITHVPKIIRENSRTKQLGEPVSMSYDRITFDRESVKVPGEPVAPFVAPGHPLFDALTALIIEQHAALLHDGVALVDPRESSEEIRILCYLRHIIESANHYPREGHRVLSQRMEFIEIDGHGKICKADNASYRRYRPLSEAEQKLWTAAPPAWLRGNWKDQVLTYAANWCSQHSNEWKTTQETWLSQTEVAVKERMTKESRFWERHAMELKELERLGKTEKYTPEQARQRAEELQARLQKRLQELAELRNCSEHAPEIFGFAIIVPQSFFHTANKQAPQEEDFWET